MTTWFTADTHLSHKNIIKYCNRPFSDIDAMNAAIINNWNAVVQPDDEVWHLGDFAFRNAESHLARLMGRKHLIWGNHDSSEVRNLAGWDSSQPMAEIIVNNTQLVLLHYGMRVWRKSGRGSLHLYGHSHGTLPGDSQSCDVGVDCWQFRPVRLQEIKQRLATLPTRYPVDHHGRSDEAES